MIAAEDSGLSATEDTHFLFAQYITSHTAPVVELVKFEYRLSALIWLRNALSHAVATEAGKLRALRNSGQHLVPGWEAESDDALGESLGLLEEEIPQISAGAIIVAGASALESLITDLLSIDESGKTSARGLQQKARSLADRWPNDSALELLEHTTWIAGFRNSFAHRLVDETETAFATNDPQTFDFQTVDETFARLGAAHAILCAGYEEYARNSSYPRRQRN